MLKKVLLSLSILSVYFLMLVNAQVFPSCDLRVALVSQDPYPAIQGDYVKLLFQLEGNGVTNPSCGKIYFELTDKFPISFDPGTSKVSIIQSGNYAQNFQSFVLFPYKVKVNTDALDGENQIETHYTANYGLNAVINKKEFNFTVEDVRTNFETSVRDYEKSTNTVTFEILNIGKSDVEALTVEISKQENIEIKGSNRNIIGSLDSNEDAIFSFEGIPKEGDISLTVLYTDKTGTRRFLTETVVFDPSYFEGRASEDSRFSWTWIIVILAIIIATFILIRKKMNKKHHLQHKHTSLHSSK